MIDLSLSAGRHTILKPFGARDHRPPISTRSAEHRLQWEKRLPRFSSILSVGEWRLSVHEMLMSA